MKKILKFVLLGILVFLVIAFLGLTYFIGKEVFESFTNPSTREETRDNLLTYYMDEYEEFESLHKVEQISIGSSQFDHDIPAIFVKDDKNTDIAVLVHGIGTSKESLTSQAEVFLDLGFNTLIYDQRNSGDNMADYTSFGVLESKDLVDVLNFAKKEKDPSGKLLLFGESAGAATSLIASSTYQDYDYLILESPLSNGYVFAEKILDEVEEKEGLPKAYMKFAADIYYKVKLGFTLDDMNTLNYIRDTEFKPAVLIISSKADQVTPVEMSEDIYKNLETNRKDLHIEEKYGHTRFPIENQDKFKEIVEDFIKKYE
ncbi:MAG: alpha/beta hydrolase [Anaerococcus sp.]|nr:alpha/beta hydrolase [Anaerococcus sp.]